MPKPLISENPQPRDLQFTHFGVLNTGGQSKSSLFTSISVNILLALAIVIIGAAARSTVKDVRVKEATYVVPVKAEPPPPPKPKIVPPRIVPPPPPKLETPKIKLPDVKLPDPPKPVEVKMPKPVPVITPAPPKLVVAMAAPKPVAVNLGKAASVPNNDSHPSAVSLGRTDNPIAASNRPATAAVSLGNSGMQGMPPGSGRGPSASAVSLGSGQPTGSLSGTGPRAIQGVKLGVTGGTPGGNGNGLGTSPQQVKLGGNVAAAAPSAAQVAKAPVRSGPQVTFKPKPVYTTEATAMHLEGVVSVRIRVSAGGSVSVVGVTSGLGHGLDESAVHAVEGTKFKPAIDANGNPIDWEGVVRITFQLA